MAAAAAAEEEEVTCHRLTNSTRTTRTATATTLVWKRTTWRPWTAALAAARPVARERNACQPGSTGVDASRRTVAATRAQASVRELAGHACGCLDVAGHAFCLDIVVCERRANTFAITPRFDVSRIALRRQYNNVIVVILR